MSVGLAHAAIGPTRESDASGRWRATRGDVLRSVDIDDGVTPDALAQMRAVQVYLEEVADAVGVT